MPTLLTFQGHYLISYINAEDVEFCEMLLEDQEKLILRKGNKLLRSSNKLMRAVENILKSRHVAARLNLRAFYVIKTI